MVNYTESPIPTLKLQADQLFSSRVMKKYNWAFASGKGVKLEHKQEQQAKSKDDSKIVFSPQIHLQQTITPLHLNIIMQYLKFSQIPIYKQQLLVSPDETIQRKNNLYIQNKNVTQTEQVKQIEQKNAVTQHNNTSTQMQQLQNVHQHKHEQNITQQLKQEHHVQLQQMDELHQNHVHMIQQQNNKQLQVIEHVHQNELKRVEATIVRRMESLVELYENKHKHIHVTSTILEQLLPYFHEDKLLTQLKQHYEQQTYRVNATIQQHKHNIYKTVHYSSLQLSEHDHPAVDVEQRTTNNTIFKQALTVVQKPLIYNWHERVDSSGREATNSSLFSTSEVQQFAKQLQTTQQPIQLESTKLEHRQISMQSDLRNLLNIRRTVEEKQIKLTVQQQNQLKTIQLASKSNPVSLFTRAITIKNDLINRTELINKDSSHHTFEPPSIHIPSDEALKNQEADSSTIVSIVQQQNNVLQSTLQHATSSPHIVVNNINSESITHSETKRGRGRPKKNTNTTSLQVNGTEQKLDAITSSSIVGNEHVVEKVIEQKPLHLTYKENLSAEAVNEQLEQATEHKVAERVRETILQLDMKQYAERLKKRYEKQNQPMKLILEKINVISNIEHLSEQDVVVNDKFVKATTRQLKQTIKQEVINESQLLHSSTHFIDNHSHRNETLFVQREQQQMDSKQVVVNSTEKQEQKLITNQLVVKDTSSNITQVDVHSLKRQVIRQDDLHTGLFVKQQHDEEKTVSSNQVEQLRQQVKMLETQIEQQNETLKQSNQRINVKQLSNQVYEELLRKIKFERQRLGR